MSASFRNFVIARILLTIPMVLILVTMVFFVMRVLPGDLIRSQLGPKVSEEQARHPRAPGSQPPTRSPVLRVPVAYGDARLW